MAGVALQPDTLTSSILPYFNRKLRDNFFTSSVAFELFSTLIERVDGGAYLQDQIMYNSSPQADVWPGGIATASADFIGNTTSATWNPIYYLGAIGIPDTFAILNQGSGMIVDLIAGQYEQMLMSMVDKINTDFFGNGASRNNIPVLQGLQAICTSAADPSAGAYGGITRVGSSGAYSNPSGTSAWWNANVLTINGGSQTVWTGTVNTGVSTISNYGAYFAFLIASSVGMFRPLAILCDPLAYQGYGNLLVATVRQTPLEGVLRNGARGLSFADIPVIMDVHCPSGTIFSINDLLKWCIWKNGAFVETPWRTPSNALVNIKYVVLVNALKHERPNTMTVMSGITG
jgi:hypothetical protein